MKVIGITQVRRELFHLVDKVIEHSEPLQISGKRGDAVLVSLADWEAMQETMHLLCAPGMRESLLAARAEPLSEGIAMEEIEWDTE